MHFAAVLLALTSLADPLCGDIAKLVEGGREPIPFQTLRDADFKPGLLQFGCFPGGVGYFCQQGISPPEVTREAISGRIAACLPDAKIAVENKRRGVSQTVVTGSGLEFVLEESQSEVAKAQRVLRIQITADR
ncbi:MAG: hypothetical protein EOP60_03365 [Sphingomonadales bacterium]|nr:MAG: hypothetical protein EOP60_03365 [Sphingomonadales bacterium]